MEGHGLNLAAHIHVADKGSYYMIDDAVAAHEAGGDTVPMPPRIR